FSFVKSGFWVGTGFLVAIGLITMLLDLMYGEIILRTQRLHQITGYTEKYLGSNFKKVIFFSLALTFYSALLIYTILAGDFLSNIFSSVFYFSPTSYSLSFFFFASLLVLAGIKRFSWLEFILAGLFSLVIIAILVVGWPKIDFANFSGIQPEFWFLPYGILIFAFAGFSAIPIQRELLGEQEHLLRKAIIFSVIFVGILYFIFSFTVAGISGDVTTPDAVSGLYEFLGWKIVFLGSLFGIFAVSTAFFMLGSAFLETFVLDYGLSRKSAWLLTVFPPLLLFLGGFRAFIDIMSLAGSVAIGLEGIILILVYIKSKSKGDRVPEYSLELPKIVYYFLMLIFLSGIVYALFVG
ncbi:MAG: aromatic amino acid transport family protein, partial [Candidatus Paceibacterota bacterium]